MRTLLTTKAQIEAAKATLAAYERSGALPVGGEEALWAAQKIKDTCLHADTGHEILPLFRISSYVPVNMVIAGGMLLPGAGLANQVFWQWVNQSYNIGVNHANRNASNPVSDQELAVNYGAAVSTSVGVAVGLTRLAQSPRVQFLSPRARAALLTQVPFVSVALSNLVNVFMVRRNEMTTGVSVKRADGTVVGKSQTAGWQAAWMTSAVRIGASLPLMTLVPVATTILAKRPALQQRPWLLKGPVNLSLIFVALLVGLPPATALFPQQIAVDALSLEPRFHNLHDDKGERVTTLYYNRGL